MVDASALMGWDPPSITGRVYSVRRSASEKTVASGQKAKTLAMPRTDSSEVATIQGDHGLRPEALGQGDHSGVSTAQRKIGILLHELTDPRPIGSNRCLDVETFEPAKKTGLGQRTSGAVDQVGGLRDTKSGNDEVEVGALESLEAGKVCWICSVRGCDQRTAIHDRD
jgi:hypothetical protein